VVRETGSVPLLQVSLDSTNASTVSGCLALTSLYENGQRRQISSGSNSSAVNVTLLNGDEVVLLYPTTGLEVHIVVKSSTSFGCFFTQWIVLPGGYRRAESLTGLLGNGNGNPSDDWQTKLGGTLPTPDTEMAFYQGGYEYCRTEWCIQNATESLFTYGSGTSFTTYFDCNATYQSGIKNSVANASLALRNLCGNNVQCIIDGVVGSNTDAQVYLNDTRRIEKVMTELNITYETVPAPAPAPVPIPVPTPVSVPVKAPVPVPTRAVTDTPSQSPSSRPIKAPVKAPLIAPIPVPLPLSVPVPLSAPVTVPVPASIPTPVIAPMNAPVPLPAPVKVPVPLPVPVIAPAPLLAPAPLPVPVTNPVPLSIPIPVVVPASTPVTAPIAVPVPVLVPATLPVPVPVPVKVPIPLPVPGVVPVPVTTPMVAPAPAPTPMKSPVATPTRRCGLLGLRLFCPFTGCGLLGRLLGICRR
jgi:hypothetical protein